MNNSDVTASEYGASGDALTFSGMVAPEAPIKYAAPEEMRSWAISQVLAAWADARDYPTQRFRTERLDGRLLAPAAITRWIHEAGDRDGRTSQYLENVPWEAFQPQQDGYLLPQEWVNALVKRLPITPTLGGSFELATWGGAGAEERPTLRSKWLLYVAPEWNENTSQKAVSAGGVLDELRRISVNLLLMYPWWGKDPRKKPNVRRFWGLAHATAYALTGYAPLVDERLFPLRKGKGVHPQSPKHLQLAVFTARREGQKLADRMEEWNSLFPDWAYGRTTNFGWDSRQAVRRLITSKMPDNEETQESVSTPSDEEIGAAMRELNRQQGIEDEDDDEGAVMVEEVSQLVEDAKSRGEPENAKTVEREE